ncbi:MAG: N-acetylmuramoyl-L-alanine amidase [Clostridiales bacterium]|nr:N-acetylmuramoyl-L-alanine amidase [Clostridiales bacterium]
MFIVWKSKRVIAVLLALIVAQLCLTAFLCVRQFSSADTSLIDFTVVIDAGHGGIDGGVVGVDGVKESSLNLVYAKELGSIFEKGGFNVVYTRTTEGGLYGLPTKGFKLRDMQARKKVIDEARADLVISVHMNKFSQSTRRGPQVFYQEGEEAGRLLAASLQRVFNDFTGNHHEAIAGDYYVCREIDCPSVIVECGFLSNADECAQLQTDGYRQQICNYIFSGVMLYLYGG